MLEGIHLVDGWLRLRGAPERLVVAQRGLSDPEVAALLARAGVAPLVIADRLFDALGTLPSPAPLLAVIATPEPTAPPQLDGDVVILDRLQDPGNVGAIIRTAAAAGVELLVTTPQTAWCWSPKVLRAAMGGHFALAIHESVPWEEIAARLAVPLAGALAHGGRSLHDLDLTPPCAWVFGSEGDGLAPAIAARLDWQATIPQSDRVESLNVAAAAAICLFEQRRQRGRG
ncbi:MAG: TrmH family RNA methyltransferase [Lautropia sp.]